MYRLVNKIQGKYFQNLTQLSKIRRHPGFKADPKDFWLLYIPVPNWRSLVSSCFFYLVLPYYWSLIKRSYLHVSFLHHNICIPYRCKSSGYRKSKASKGDTVVNYREPLATKELRYHGVSRRVKNMHYETFFPGIQSGFIPKASVRYS